MHGVLLFLPLLLLSSPLQSSYILSDLSTNSVSPLSCLVGICFVAEGCERSPVWRRVLLWPDWETNEKECLHGFMIRKNLFPSQKGAFPKDLVKVWKEMGEEYVIVMASGGPSGPAREMSLENPSMRPIFTVSHQNFEEFPTKRGGVRGEDETQWRVASYDFQRVNKKVFEAGLVVYVKKANPMKDWCIFVRSRLSEQHLCGGLERLFKQLPSRSFPMQMGDCQYDLRKGFKRDDNGFFKCKEHETDDYVISLPPPSSAPSDTPETYVRMHNAFCAAGKTMYLVEDHRNGIRSLEFNSSQTSLICGSETPAKSRCTPPPIPQDVVQYCGERCEKAGISKSPFPNDERDVLRCDFMLTVIDEIVYKKGEEPLIFCDATGWWRYTERMYEANISRWVHSVYCFYETAVVQSDCVLDRFQCGKYGECPVNRQNQVDCDGNTQGLVLAVFHPSLRNGFAQVDKLGCDAKNRWWTVNGQSLAQTAVVDCVYPMELEILRRTFVHEDWNPKKVEPRVLSQIGPTIRSSTIVLAVIALVMTLIGVFVSIKRLQAPKARMLTQRIRALYPSLLNEPERLDAAKAEAEYKRVDCEAAGLALYEVYVKLAEVREETEEFSDQLHLHWASLNWSTRNLLRERVLLHRSFFGLKSLYKRFNTRNGSFEVARPGLKSKIAAISQEYNAFTNKWPPLSLIYSLAFATLTNSELEAFRSGKMGRKQLRAQPFKEDDKDAHEGPG